ncbi:MAG: hypothetical protein MUC62_08445 [Candidatus Thermoplasmatota archaeon]|jgi:hypothetical protein|nr:hypothetical protein [Candidatus Thermoplasmatota archaeon]
MGRKVLTTPAKKGPDPAGIYPIRSDVRWSMRGDCVVLEYPKNLNRFERFLKRFLGGPDDIKRPLDKVGTMLWSLSDGEHSLLEIYLAEQEAFKERVEPVDRVVGGLLESMLALGLMRLSSTKGGRTGKGAARVIVRMPARDGRSKDI